MSTNGVRALNCCTRDEGLGTSLLTGSVVAGHLQITSRWPPVRAHTQIPAWSSSAGASAGPGRTRMVGIVRPSGLTGRARVRSYLSSTPPTPPPRSVTSLPASARPDHLPHPSWLHLSPAVLCNSMNFKTLCDPEAVQAHRLKVGHVKSPRHPDATGLSHRLGGREAPTWSVCGSSVLFKSLRYRRGLKKHSSFCKLHRLPLIKHVRTFHPSQRFQESRMMEWAVSIVHSGECVFALISR